MQLWLRHERFPEVLPVTLPWLNIQTLNWEAKSHRTELKIQPIFYPPPWTLCCYCCCCDPFSRAAAPTTITTRQWCAAAWQSPFRSAKSLAFASISLLKTTMGSIWQTSLRYFLGWSMLKHKAPHMPWWESSRTYKSSLLSDAIRHGPSATTLTLTFQSSLCMALVHHCGKKRNVADDTAPLATAPHSWPQGLDKNTHGNVSPTSPTFISLAWPLTCDASHLAPSLLFPNTLTECHAGCQQIRCQLHHKIFLHVLNMIHEYCMSVF